MAQSTFSVATGADDGYAQRPADASYPPASASASNSDQAEMYAIRELTTGYRIFVALMRFDTSSLPDAANITGATLRVYVTLQFDGGEGRNIVGEYYDFYPVDDTDYTATASASAFTGVPLTAFTVGAYKDITLTSLSGINKTGYTSFRLHMDGGQPAVRNYLGFMTVDGGSSMPQLVVDYSTTPRIVPDAIVSQSNLTGTLSAVTDDPDSPDATFLTAP